MNKSHYERIENTLYLHYERIREKKRISKRLLYLDDRRVKLQKDIENMNISFNCIGGIDYLVERVNSTFNTNSSMEKDLDRGMTKLENQYKATLLNIINLKRRLRAIEDSISNVDILLSELNEDERELVLLKYGHMESYRRIGDLVNCSHTTASREIDRIIGELKRNQRNY